MKINKIMSAAALLVGLTAVSQAQTSVYISGSTAFRTQIYAALVDLGLTLSPASSTSPAGNNSEFYSGTVTATTLAGQPILTTGTAFNVFTAFTGSAEAINTLANPQGPGNTSPPYTTSTGAVISYTGGADLGLSDVLASTTQYAAAAANANGGAGLNDVPSFDQNIKGPGGFAVVPFTFATTSYGLAHGITNITAPLVNQLYSAGTVPLSFFSGINTDSNTPVYAVGRTNDSGTRYTMQLVGANGNGGLNTTFPSSNMPWVIAPTMTAIRPDLPPGIQSIKFATGGTNWVAVGNDGYASGGNIAKVLSASPTTPATNAAAIGYVSWSDAQGNMTSGNGGPISFEGVNPTTVNSGWVPGTTPWNTNAVENGATNTGAMSICMKIPTSPAEAPLITSRRLGEWRSARNPQRVFAPDRILGKRTPCLSWFRWRSHQSQLRVRSEIEVPKPGILTWVRIRKGPHLFLGK
jgi:hypothetical protein